MHLYNDLLSSKNFDVHGKMNTLYFGLHNAFRISFTNFIEATRDLLRNYILLLLCLLNFFSFFEETNEMCTCIHFCIQILQIRNEEFVCENFKAVLKS
jgi:hypothetical protein